MANRGRPRTKGVLESINELAHTTPQPALMEAEMSVIPSQETEIVSLLKSIAHELYLLRKHSEHTLKYGNRASQFEVKYD